METSLIQINVPQSPFSSYFPDSFYTNELGSEISLTTPSSVYIEDRLPITYPHEPIGSYNITLSKTRSIVIIACITASTAIATMLSGLVTISTPQIALDLELGASSSLWPSSIHSLTCGSSLLISGTLSDKFGGNVIYIIGLSLQTIFILGCGLSLSGSQLIIFRGLGGLAASLCSSSAVNIIGNTFAPGLRRNIAFASLGAGQTVGIGIGFTLGGFLTGTIGWRWGFRVACLLNLLVLLISYFHLPLKKSDNLWRRLFFEIDWIGAALLTSFLVLVLFVLSYISGNISRIRQPQTIILLVLAALTLPGYTFWIAKQERNNKPALIPNALWRNVIFTVICVNIYIMWAAACALDQILSFVFQEVRLQNVLTAALEFLPEPISSTTASAVTGVLVHRYRADRIIIITTLLSCVPPVLLAVSNYHLPYWSEEFPALLLNSINLDALFIISNLMITTTFPQNRLGLAGGVFNTIAQIGRSSGITFFGLISETVTATVSPEFHGKPDALMKGYRAASWFCFGLNILSLCITTFFLRHIGKVGKK